MEAEGNAASPLGDTESQDEVAEKVFSNKPDNSGEREPPEKTEIDPPEVELRKKLEENLKILDEKEEKLQCVEKSLKDLEQVQIRKKEVLEDMMEMLSRDRSSLKSEKGILSRSQKSFRPSRVQEESLRSKRQELRKKQLKTELAELKRLSGHVFDYFKDDDYLRNMELAADSCDQLIKTCSKAADRLKELNSAQPDLKNKLQNLFENANKLKPRLEESDPSNWDQVKILVDRLRNAAEATEKDEAKLAVMETTMLRWTAGVTKLDHVKNEDMRKRFGVAPIREKLRENRLRWFGHVLRADPTSIAKTSHTLEVDGKRPRGRPKRRWMDTLNEALKATKLHPDQAADRTKWRQRSRKADPATERDRR
ncbi:unnamed protein product [Caenorhabditis auriculariae]|uniref:Uncharacterized protein n=1 Tax=Caenorhabditis auriculariae TaxID=2777116 RepID=A0A8S1HY54_9PELO|nr:unnamed protein product [Caenorhabditis auriculariae]